MTQDQKNALNRLKAAYAASNDVEVAFGTFHTGDLEMVLQVLQDQEDKLSCVKSDLMDLFSYIQDYNKDGMLESMVESVLMFLADGNESE